MLDFIAAGFIAAFSLPVHHRINIDAPFAGDVVVPVNAKTLTTEPYLMRQRVVLEWKERQMRLTSEGNFLTSAKELLAQAEKDGGKLVATVRLEKYYDFYSADFGDDRYCFVELHKVTSLSFRDIDARYDRHTVEVALPTREGECDEPWIRAELKKAKQN